MNREVTLRLVASAGVLVGYKGTKILIDGIFHHNLPGLSNIPDPLLNEMLVGSGQYKDIDYLLFSHCHPDHFSPELTTEYVRNNRVKRVFLPETDTNLPELLKSNKQLYTTLNLPLGSSCKFSLEDDIALTAFPTVHMGKQYQSVINYCYLLAIGQKNILFTADADYVDSYYEKTLNGINIDTVFVNPLFFTSKTGRDVLEKIVKPGNVGIYHIPFKKDDRFGFQRMVKKDIEKHKLAPYEIFALWDGEETRKV
jgi:L-ascorbate metabolism protein UlaG (beta-lactamase superfamily)